MALYSLLLMAVLVFGAPNWLARMMGSGRYLAGLGQRLGRVPAELRAAVSGRQVAWIHAVSVGEVLAATRLVGELEAALGDGWVILVSTTTATGQMLARERFAAGADGAGRVFYYPLDFAWAVRAYLCALRPKVLVLMENELWPRMLVECNRAGVPVAVVNARVSDKSFARGVRARAVWGWVLRRVELFLTQSEEDARRLVAMGARADAVSAMGNLKYDVLAPKESQVAEWIKRVADTKLIIVAGSTAASSDEIMNSPEFEEELVVRAWESCTDQGSVSMLVLAPRHPERFRYAQSLASKFALARATVWLKSISRDVPDDTYAGFDEQSLLPGTKGRIDVVLLDTIGDLAAVYGVADVAFVGGSLVRRGGHNPLEPAQFGVPVVMGPSYENFRDIVTKMQAADGIRIVQDKDELQAALVELLTDREAARAMGERGRRVFEQQQGATARTVEGLLGLVRR
jgi:3-deoxy-D-manno-octulosonic-acid transferase